jgi:signal transduction histidine kinase
VSVGRDITERRALENKEAKLQAEVAQSARQWRATFDTVDSAIVILYRDLRVRRLNRAARDIADKPFAALKGMRVGEIGDGPLWRAFSEAAERALASSLPVSLHAHDEAAGHTWDVSASPLADGADGDVILLARDVSRIVELQESLRRNETLSAIGQVVAGVAHEVRNPLFGIQAMLDAFEIRFKDRPEYQEHSVRLRLQVERLTELMQDLLDYGRPNPPRLARGSLSRVIQEAATACGGSARRAGARLETDVAPDLPDVLVDEARLVQVYRNLIDNALQHSRAGSQVLISARSDGDGLVESSVSDSGPGFSEADLPRLFEPFFTRRAGGTGLGLSIVERIVSAHGGRVLAQNRPEGGATVRVWLPRAPSPGAILAESERG